MSGVELFVWYRCPAEQAALVGRAAASLLARVARDCGVQGRLLQRQEGECTWMEHYALEADPARLQGLLASMEQGWAPGLPSRHLESFQPLPHESLIA